MFTNNFEIILFTIMMSVTGFGFLILASSALLGFLKPQRPILERSGGRPSFYVLQKRRGATNIPTITCSLPITTQKRSQQRLW